MLTAGNFLGGVWANESWGRYWGWDPKETWALISICVYALILHLRFLGSQNWYLYFSERRRARVLFGFDDLFWRELLPFWLAQLCRRRSLADPYFFILFGSDTFYPCDLGVFQTPFEFA